MRKNYKYLIINKLLIILVCLSLTGCSVYVPQMADIPLIKEKNELKGDGGFSMKEMFYGTFSYGLTDHIALQVYFNKSYDERSFAHYAAGYYRNLGDNRILEVYLGFGNGHTLAGNHDIPTRLEGPYQLYFVQFNYGKTDTKVANADLGFGIKAGFLHSNLEDFNYFNTIPYYTGPSYPLKVNNLIIEPALFLRIGGKRLKLSIKSGSCIHFQINQREKKVPVDYINAGLGFSYRF